MTINGVSAVFQVSTAAEWQHFHGGITGEREVLSDILERIRSQDVFFDIGANVGFYSCFVGQEASTISFEPQPANAARCSANLAENGIEGQVKELAVSDDSGIATLSVEERGVNPGAGRSSLRGNSPSSESVTVETGRIDDLVEASEVPRPTVVKIDVEGAEVEVLRGMTGILDECRLIYCEIHQEHGVLKQDVHQILDEYGFEETLLKDRDGQSIYRYDA